MMVSRTPAESPAPSAAEVAGSNPSISSVAEAEPSQPGRGGRPRLVGRGIRAKILIVIGLAAGPMVVVLVAAFWSAASQLEASGLVEHTLRVIAEARHLNDDVVELQTEIAGSVLSGDPGAAARADASYRDALVRVTTLAGLVGDKPPQATRVAGLRRDLERWREGSAAGVLRALRAADQRAATPLALRSGADMRDLRRRVEAFVGVEEGLLRERMEVREHAQARTRLLTFLAGAFVLLGAVLAGGMIGGRIIRPLDELTRAVEGVAVGDLSRKVTLRTGDEVERLGLAFNRMVVQVTDRELALERARRGAETLVQIQRDLAENLDPLTILRKILHHARLLSDSDFAFLATREGEETAARVVALDGAWTDAFQDLLIEPGRGVEGRAMDLRRPYGTADYRTEFDATSGYARQAAAEGLVSVLAVPMLLERELIGILYVASRMPRPFGPEDETVLLELAAPAALAVRNARLVDELARQRDWLAERTRELAQLAAIVQSSDDAIIGKTTTGIITSWNPGAERIYGYRADEVVGRSASLLTPPDRPDELSELIGLVLLGEHVVNLETVRVRKGGTRIDVNLTVSPIRDESGSLVGLSTITRDVTQLRAVQRMKDEFIGTVSHELRTPLTAIRGHLELVLDGDAGPVTDIQRQFLDVAARNTDRLAALINDLLDVEKIEAGKLQLRRERLDLSAVLRDVQSAFALQAERKGLALAFQVPDELPVVGDGDRLLRVFSNLVSNAIKYTPWGEVRIEAGRVGGDIEVLIADTGIGISPDEQRQLFTKFFRSRDPVAQDAGGTGLGLVISKGILDLHGGTIQVDSRKGEGTRFRVTLPRAAPANEEPEPGWPGQPTVLVVEDDDAIRSMLLEQIRRMGYRGVGAAGGAEALELARRLFPEAILLDLLMPAPDGWDVLLGLKRDPATREIPIVVHSIVDDRERGLLLGVHDYLVKPVEASRLRDAVLSAVLARPASIFLIHPDPEAGTRLRRELRGERVLVRQVRDLARARELVPTGPAVAILNREQTGGDAGELLHRWLEDPVFRDVPILLTGDWPSGMEEGSHAVLVRARLRADDGSAANGGAGSEGVVVDKVRELIETLREGIHGEHPAG